MHVSRPARVPDRACADTRTQRSQSNRETREKKPVGISRPKEIVATGFAVANRLIRSSKMISATSAGLAFGNGVPGTNSPGLSGLRRCGPAAAPLDASGRERASGKSRRADLLPQEAALLLPRLPYKYLGSTSHQQMLLGNHALGSAHSYNRLGEQTALGPTRNLGPVPDDRQDSRGNLPPSVCPRRSVLRGRRDALCLWCFDRQRLLLDGGDSLLFPALRSGRLDGRRHRDHSAGLQNHLDRLVIDAHSNSREQNPGCRISRRKQAPLPGTLTDKSALVGGMARFRGTSSGEILFCCLQRHIAFPRIDRLEARVMAIMRK